MQTFEDKLDSRGHSRGVIKAAEGDHTIHQVVMFPHDTAVFLRHHHVRYFDGRSALEALNKFPEGINLEGTIEDFANCLLNQVIDDVFFASFFNALELDLACSR